MVWFVRLCRLWWCVLPLVALSLPVHAAPDIQVASADRPDVIEVPDVVVSATKTEIPAKQVTSAVEVITGEEIERKKIKTVIDALRLAQGVFATSSGGPGTEATVKMRGAFILWLASWLTACRPAAAVLVVPQSHILPNGTGALMLKFLGINAADMNWDIMMLWVIFIIANIATYVALSLRMRLAVDIA